MTPRPRIAAGLSVLVIGCLTVAGEPALAQGGADLQVTITGTSSVAQDSGSKFATLSLRNHGPNPATNVGYTIDVSNLDMNKIRFVDIECDGDPDGDGLLFCDVESGSIAPGEDLDLFMAFQRVLPLTTGVAGTVTVTATHAGPDPDQSNNSVTANVTIGAHGADFRVLVDDVRNRAVPAPGGWEETTQPISPGDHAIVTARVTNFGDRASTIPLLQVTLPPQVSFAATDPHCSHAIGDTTTSCSYGDITLAPADLHDGEEHISLVALEFVVQVAATAPPDPGPLGGGSVVAAVEVNDTAPTDNQDEFTILIGVPGEDAIAVGQLPRLAGPFPDVAQRRSDAAGRCLTVSDGDVVVRRAAGPDRYQTAVCASRITWMDHDDPDAPPGSKAEVVVLARGDKFPDALAGGPLAAYLQGPLLLTKPTELPRAVADEIDRVLAPGSVVYIMGGATAVSNELAEDLVQAGYEIFRVFGANRFETATRVAEILPETSNFFFVTGRNFPDALAAGTAAAALTLAAVHDSDPGTRPFALLLTDDEQMPPKTLDLVQRRGDQFGVWTLVTAGGAADRAAVAAFGAASLAARVAGPDRYATAAAIAELVFPDAPGGELVGEGVGLTTGQNFPDALSATAHLAIFGAPLLLTPPASLHPEAESFLAGHAGEGSYLTAFGGTSNVSSQALAEAAAAYTP